MDEHQPRHTRASLRPRAGGRRALALVVALITLLALTLTSCGSESSESSPSPSPTITPSVVASQVPGSVLDAAKSGDLDAFLKAVTAAGLQKQLAKAGPFTVFAPNDEAFASMTLPQLKLNAENLKAVVQYHVVSGQDIELQDVSDGQQFTTLQGEPVTFTFDGAGGTMVNDATVVAAYAGAEWTIYAVDKVLTPPSLAPASPSP